MRSLSFSQLLGPATGIVYRMGMTGAPGRGKVGVVVVMQSSDIETARGIPVQALVAEADMMAAARDAIATWSRANNGDFYAIMIEMEDATARDNLVAQLTDSIRMLSS